MPTIRMARADNPSPMTLDGTRTFVIGTDRPVVIDPGPADAAHLHAVVRLLEGTKPAAILLTHAHADHAGNADALAISTGAPICMARGAKSFPFPQDRVARWLTHGDEIECGNEIVQVVATPGHTPEHLAYFQPSSGGSGTLFAGDLFLGVGDTTLVSAPEGNLADYLRSLEVVRALRPGLIYPAHGPAIRRPDLAISRYLAHRHERIAQVQEARRLHPGATAVEMVESVYGGELDPRLRGAAAGSIQAMLNYLESREGADW